MKNLFKKSVLGLWLLTATLANANVNFKNVKIFSENSKSLNIQLNNNDGESEVFIKDKYGIQLYNEDDCPNFGNVKVSDKVFLITVIKM